MTISYYTKLPRVMTNPCPSLGPSPKLFPFQRDGKSRAPLGEIRKELNDQEEKSVLPGSALRKFTLLRKSAHLKVKH